MSVYTEEGERYSVKMILLLMVSGLSTVLGTNSEAEGAIEVSRAVLTFRY